MDSGDFALPSQRFEPLVYGVGAWTPHLHFACDLIALTRPSLFVELGTDRGESYFTFCQAASENDTGTRCCAVDTWRGDSQAGQYDETTFAQVTAYNEAHYKDFSTLLRSSFDGALGRFEPGSINLLHLDGSHDEEAVRHDVEQWLPRLRPGGLLLMHDVTVRRSGFGVWKVWSELQRHGRAFTFHDGPGLGLWQNPPNESLPVPLEVLFSCSDSAVRLRHVDYYRSRFALLQRRIAEDWRSGAVRDQPFHQQTVIQVFHTHDGVHREEDSVNARLGHKEWKEVTIALPPNAGTSPLRVDFVSPLTVIEIAALRLQSAKRDYFTATNPSQFDAIILRGDLERLPGSDSLRLKIIGIDPQLYLPALVPDSPEEKLFLQMRLRVHPSR